MAGEGSSGPGNERDQTNHRLKKKALHQRRIPDFVQPSLPPGTAPTLKLGWHVFSAISSSPHVASGGRVMVLRLIWRDISRSR